jgi:pimeloyl-ACP methyl ester carboxylesterase
MPILYLFDSHGKGSFPVSRYKTLADTYGFILVCSNDSKNGNDYITSDHIWLALTGDTRARLAIDTSRIYACGFSGGAKVAGYVAIMHPEVKGVILNGAGLPDGAPVDNFEFDVTLLTGEGDLNMTDMEALDNRLDSTRTRHRILFFDGKHEWAPLGTMNTALAGIQLDAMHRGLIPKDEGFISRYVSESRARFDTDRAATEWIAAERECVVSISFLEGLSGEVAWFKQSAASVADNPSYKRLRDAQRTMVSQEQNAKDGYMEHFDRPENAYWSGVIDSLSRAGSVGGLRGAMAQRLTAFLSLEFYTYSSHLVNSRDDEAARYFTDLYKRVDPTNSEAWFLSATLYARSGQRALAEDELKKAVALGFNDPDRVRHLYQQ